MRLTLVISSLIYGGAERVMTIMANYWVAKGWEVTLLTFDENTIPQYHLDSRVSHIPLGIAKDSPNIIIALGNNFKRILTLRFAITDSNPDVVISFLSATNVITLLATRWLNIPVVVSERSNPEKQSIGRIWKQLCQWTYPFADLIIFQTQRARNYFSPQLKARTCIIPNPVLLPVRIKETSEKHSDERSLIAIGRFVEQKGFDLLLQAFAKIQDSYPQWTLTILGEGELRLYLEDLCNQLKLNDRVHFPGWVNNPHEFLKQADIFVMSSRYEGFPNALCEAMAYGLPVISTDCPSGPREIIRDGIDGILVPNEDISALATAMVRLMSDEKARKSLAVRAPEITERFGLEKILSMWEAALEEVIKKRKNPSYKLSSTAIAMPE